MLQSNGSQGQIVGLYISFTIEMCSMKLSKLINETTIFYQQTTLEVAIKLRYNNNTRDSGTHWSLRIVPGRGSQLVALKGGITVEGPTLEHPLTPILPEGSEKKSQGSSSSGLSRTQYSYLHFELTRKKGLLTLLFWNYLRAKRLLSTNREEHILLNQSTLRLENNPDVMKSCKPQERDKGFKGETF